MPVEVVVVRGHGLAAVLSREIVHDTPVVRYLDHGHPPMVAPTTASKGAGHPRTDRSK